VKKTLLLFASLLFLASLSMPTSLRADDGPPICDPTGCTKPVIGLVAGLTRERVSQEFLVGYRGKEL
jgi:hypothetical protein